MTDRGRRQAKRTPTMRRLINRSSAVPSYFQIVRRLRNDIAEGHLKADDFLPSEQELADSFGVTRLTLRRAIQELVGEGYIIRRQGRRSRIAKPKMRIDPCGSLTEQLDALGVRNHTDVLSSQMALPPDEVRNFLHLKKDAKALHLVRVRWVEESPVAMEDNWLVSKFAPYFLDDKSGGTYLYRTLKQSCNLSEWAVDIEVEFTSATTDEANHLQVREGRPLVSLKMILLSEDNPFGYTHVRFLAERFHHHFGFQRYPSRP